MMIRCWFKVYQCFPVMSLTLYTTCIKHLNGALLRGSHHFNQTNIILWQLLFHEVYYAHSARLELNNATHAVICKDRRYTYWLAWPHNFTRSNTFHQLLSFSTKEKSITSKTSFGHLRHRIWYCFDNYFTYFVPVFSQKCQGYFFLSMCDVKIFLTFTSPNMVLLLLLPGYESDSVVTECVWL
jgi:hypothetical protein